MSTTKQLPQTKAKAINGATGEPPADECADSLDAEATKGVDVRVVGVPYDGSSESKQALASAQRFAQSRHATLRLIAAVPPLEWWVSRNIAPEELLEWRCAEFRRRLERAAESLPAGLQHEIVLRHGHPSDVIVREAHEGIDVLFIGSQSYSRWAGVPQDDTATEVMQLAACPVIVVGPGTGLSHVIHTAAPDNSPTAPARVPRGRNRRRPAQSASRSEPASRVDEPPLESR